MSTQNNVTLGNRASVWRPRRSASPVHKIAIWPELLVLHWIYPWAAKRFKSYWPAVITQGSEGLILIVLFPMAIMGLLQN